MEKIKKCQTCGHPIHEHSSEGCSHMMKDKKKVREGWSSFTKCTCHETPYSIRQQKGNQND